MLAERIGASLNTVRRMKSGHPGTALQHLARALQVFGELDKLEALLDTPHDLVGLVVMDEKLPKRVRVPWSSARKRLKTSHTCRARAVASSAPIPQTLPRLSANPGFQN